VCSPHLCFYSVWRTVWGLLIEGAAYATYEAYKGSTKILLVKDVGRKKVGGMGKTEVVHNTRDLNNMLCMIIHPLDHSSW
jgi:hypothetical protein